LLYQDQQTFDDLAKRIQINHNLVMQCAIDMFPQLSAEQMVTFVCEYIIAHPEHKAKLQCKFLTGVARSDHRGVLITIIPRIEPDGRLQCGLFLEFGWLYEALMLASLASSFEFVPLIAYRASLLGIAKLVDECQRILSGMMLN
jgi:hypothetical protein